MFRRWCPKRAILLRGDAKEEARRVRLRDAARAQLHDIAEGGKNFVDDLLKHAEGRYSKEDLATIRDGTPLTPDLQAKIKAGVDEFAGAYFELSPYLKKVPPKHKWPHAFIYRYAVCAYTHSLHWLAAGGVRGRKPEGFRNDFIDVAICAYATCFDGLLSNDKVANKVYDGARRFLKAEHGI